MSDVSDVMGFVGGVGGIGAGVFALIRALGGRVIQNEENDKKALQTKVEKAEASERVISESLIGIKHDVAALRGMLDMMSKQVEARATAQDKEIAELRTEVKDQINQLEHRLRTEMQRLVNPPEARPRSKRR